MVTFLRISFYTIAILSMIFFWAFSVGLASIAPGTTLDPGCAPGAPGCVVDPVGIGSSVTSATSGSILFIDGSSQLAQENGELFYDTTNNRLGILTATPSQTLDVVGDITTSESYMIDGTDIVVYDSGSSSNFFIGPLAGVSNTTGTDNYFAGPSAGTSNTTGAANLFIGSNAGGGNTSGSANVYLGGFAGNVGSTGSFNVAIGGLAGQANTASGNTFVGYFSGNRTTSGAGNTFLGNLSGAANVIGTSNTFIGGLAGQSNTDSNNTFIGFNAGGAQVTGSQNTYIGDGAGSGSTNTGSRNIFLGSNSGAANTSGTSNTFVGVAAGQSSTTGMNSVVLGDSAGTSMTSASDNTLLGKSSGTALTDGGTNTFVGTSTAAFATSAAGNTIIGNSAGTSLTTGSGNIVIGSTEDVSVGTATSTLNIGGSIYGDLASDFIGIGDGAVAPAAPLHVVGDDGGGIGVAITAFFQDTSAASCSIIPSVAGSPVCTSDENLKDNILVLDGSLEKVRNLEGVTYTWKNDPTGRVNIGVIAQNIQKEYPEMVLELPDGNLAVNYGLLVVPLIEAVKELDQEVQDLKTTNRFSRVVQVVNNTSNQIFEGLTSFADIFVQKATVSELCIDDVCIDRDDLSDLLDNADIEKVEEPNINIDVPDETEGSDVEDNGESPEEPSGIDSADSSGSEEELTQDENDQQSDPEEEPVVDTLDDTVAGDVDDDPETAPEIIEATTEEASSIDLDTQE